DKAEEKFLFIETLRGNYYRVLAYVAKQDITSLYEGKKENSSRIQSTEVEEVADDFHARFKAVGRGYIYRILNRRAPTVLLKYRVWCVGYPLDVEKMKEGAKYLLGHHDFSSFRGAGCQALSPMKTLDKLEILQNGDEIDFIVEARSFLYHQVRNMVGTLKCVGDGKFAPVDVKKIIEAKDRAVAGPTAPACGLYLSKVMY
ncbi:MAG: tRNA pseudouridine synthase A, partial [Alphaproteobacteria bacterium]|nr:tRNA pseudouridine synthase A [Alphaproteobacteria bacterium]